MAQPNRSEGVARTDVEFKNSEGITLRGWFYTSSKHNGGKLPCVVISNGFGGIKEMGLDPVADIFVANLPVTCLVFDYRGFSGSETLPGQPRSELIANDQLKDLADAITYVQTRDEVDPEKIALWGTSYSGGHVLQLGAVDKRVKVVLSQFPFINGMEIFSKIYLPTQIDELNQLFQKDRLDRAAGKEPLFMPVIPPDYTTLSACPAPDYYSNIEAAKKATNGLITNQVTVRSTEAVRAYNPGAYIRHISPTPLLMVVADNDKLTPTDLALEAYSRALEPKNLVITKGGHFDGYSPENFKKSTGAQIDFLKKYLIDL